MMVRQCYQVLFLLFVVAIVAHLYGHNLWFALLPAALIALSVIILAGFLNYIAGLIRAWQERPKPPQDDDVAFDRPLNQPPPWRNPKPSGLSAVDLNDSKFDKPYDRTDGRAKPEPRPRKIISNRERNLQALIDDRNATEGERRNARQLLKIERSKER